MKPNPSVNMAEATRLTREGRLHEAMALLRGRGGLAPETHDHPGEDDAIDMAPPSAASGGAWTPRARAAAPDATPASNPSRGANSRLPASLLGKLRSMPLAGARRKAKAPGESSLPADALFELRRHESRGGARSYRVYVPSTYTGSPLPLVVMLHGCTQSPDDFAAGTGMNVLAEEQSFLVAYPEQSTSANGSKCWNWFNGDDQHRDRGEPALIAGITRAVMLEFKVDPNRVYVAGLSAGGAAAVIVARAYPELYAAVGVHSGLASGAASDVGSAFAAMRQGGNTIDSGTGEAFPTVVFHGDQDRTVNPVNAQQVLAQARGRAKLVASTTRGSVAGGRDYTRTVELDRHGTPILENWLLHGAGHAWSGGNDAGSYTDPHGPDASREMMRFFNHHTASAPMR